MTYLLVRRSTGNVNKIVDSREKARDYKRKNGFKHVIIREIDGLRVR